MCIPAALAWAISCGENPPSDPTMMPESRHQGVVLRKFFQGEALLFFIEEQRRGFRSQCGKERSKRAW